MVTDSQARSDLRARVRGLPWPAIAAAVFVILSVVLLPDRGDVFLYRHGAREAVSTGDVYSFQVRGHGFTYPPFAALVMAGLAWMPNWAMWLTLVLLGAAAFAVILQLCVPGAFRTLVGAPGRDAWLIAGLVVSEPVVITLRVGQVDLVLAALVMVDVLVLRRGVLVGLAAGLKLTPGIFVVYLLLRGRYREATAAVVTFVATVLWATVVLPGTSRLYWLHIAVSGKGVGSFTTTGNQSIHGVVSRIVGPQAGTVLWFVLAVPLLVVVLDLARRADDAGLPVLAVGTVGVLACLVSPVSWPHHWVWLVPFLSGLWFLPGRDVLLTRWVLGVGAFAIVSQIVPLKAIFIGYVPAALVLLALLRPRLAAVRATEPVRDGVAA